jgi:GNAT superfamily N-acetyltransferase
VNFLNDKCTLSIFNQEILSTCEFFDCGHQDLNDFFQNEALNYSKELLGKSYCFTLDEAPQIIVCAFTVSNDSIKANFLPNSRKKKVSGNIPRSKHFRSYPAVLIGRLGVNKAFSGKGIGKELMTFIKSWFIDAHNKTGCRFVVVDAYNEPGPRRHCDPDHLCFQRINVGRSNLVPYFPAVLPVSKPPVIQFLIPNSSFLIPHSSFQIPHSSLSPSASLGDRGGVA